MWGGVPECLVAAERQTVRLGLGSVDDTDATSPMSKSQPNAKSLEVIFWSWSDRIFAWGSASSVPRRSYQTLSCAPRDGEAQPPPLR